MSGSFVCGIYHLSKDWIEKSSSCICYKQEKNNQPQKKSSLVDFRSSTKHRSKAHGKNLHRYPSEVVSSPKAEILKDSLRRSRQVSKELQKKGCKPLENSEEETKRQEAAATYQFYQKSYEQKKTAVF